MEALWWESKGKHVLCTLCPHHCFIDPGHRGRCQVRENRQGTLHTLNYGQIGGIALDALEKKPLYHICPGSSILSVGSWGCNLDCDFCQNHQAVAGEHGVRKLAPAELVALAQELADQGNVGIAWTYTEPLVWFEYVLDSARLAQSQGLKTVLVTNGFVNSEPWQQLLKYIDAVNIDLKAIRPGFYRRRCGGSPEPVLYNIQTAVTAGVHVEVTTLLIPGENTDPGELDVLSRRLAAIDPNLPLHLSRYYPARRLQLPATEPEMVRSSAELARRHLFYVYTGNLADSHRNTTFCPQCGHTLVRRGEVTQVDIDKNCCPRCNHRLNIILN